VNARIDLAIIAGLAEDDQASDNTEPTCSRPDRFRRHLARLLTPWTAGRLRPCGCPGKPDRP
jgi:hypothetical protein